jgi:hypothetical protein
MLKVTVKTSTGETTYRGVKNVIHYADGDPNVRCTLSIEYETTDIHKYAHRYDRILYLKIENDDPPTDI